MKTSGVGCDAIAAKNLPLAGLRVSLVLGDSVSDWISLEAASATPGRVSWSLVGKNDPDVLEMVLKTSLEAEDGIQAASMSSSFLLSLVSVTVGETGLT